MVKMHTNLVGPIFGRTALRLAMIAAVGLATSGCVSLENEEGKLPSAMRSAIATLSAKGYPDLTKIPDAPTDLPSVANWTSLENGLVSQGQELASDPKAVPPTTDEASVAWAETEKQALESDPRAEALPPVVPGREGDNDWAAAAKAKLDADLARLPPT